MAGKCQGKDISVTVGGQGRPRMVRGARGRVQRRQVPNRKPGCSWFRFPALNGSRRCRTQAPFRCVIGDEAVELRRTRWHSNGRIAAQGGLRPISPGPPHCFRQSRVRAGVLGSHTPPAVGSGQVLVLRIARSIGGVPGSNTSGWPLVHVVGPVEVADQHPLELIPQHLLHHRPAPAVR